MRMDKPAGSCHFGCNQHGQAGTVGTVHAHDNPVLDFRVVIGAFGDTERHNHRWALGMGRKRAGNRSKQTPDESAASAGADHNEFGLAA